MSNLIFSIKFEIVRANNAGILRYWNLGVFSVIWKDNYNPEFGHYKSRCKYLTVGYADILYKGKLLIGSVIHNTHECIRSQPILNRKLKYIVGIIIVEPERIVDIGFLDRWWFTKKAMEDYDISSDEWNEQGSPVNEKDQLKPMW